MDSGALQSWEHPSRYAFIVAYDGADFCGWQEQPDVRTVAGELKTSFRRIFKSNLSIVSSSRTDAGVHALGQVVRITTDLDIDAEQLRRAWNCGLPRDLHIRRLNKVSDRFHPHHGLVAKMYWYHFSPQRVLPFCARYCTWYPYPFDKKVFSECLKKFEGLHDFWSFGAGNEVEDPICTLYSVKLYYLKRWGIYRISFCGDRFLYHMVRRMVGGALLIAGDPGRSPEEITQAFETRPSRERFETAPPEGLVLYRIRFEPGRSMRDLSIFEPASYTVEP